MVSGTGRDRADDGWKRGSCLPASRMSCMKSLVRSRHPDYELLCVFYKPRLSAAGRDQTGSENLGPAFLDRTCLREGTACPLGLERRFTWPGSRRPRRHRTRSADAVRLHPRAPGTCAGASASWEPEGGRASPPRALTRTLCPEIKLKQTLEGFGGQTLPGPGLRQRVRGQALLSRNPRQGWEAAGWGQVMGKESDWRPALNGAICDRKSRLYKEHRLCDKPEGRREGVEDGGLDWGWQWRQSRWIETGNRSWGWAGHGGEGKK